LYYNIIHRRRKVSQNYVKTINDWLADTEPER